MLANTTLIKIDVIILGLARQPSPSLQPAYIPSHVKKIGWARTWPATLAGSWARGNACPSKKFSLGRAWPTMISFNYLFFIELVV
jgi:hypothetical protein